MTEFGVHPWGTGSLLTFLGHYRSFVGLRIGQAFSSAIVVEWGTGPLDTELPEKLVSACAGLMLQAPFYSRRGTMLLLEHGNLSEDSQSITVLIPSKLQNSQ